MMKMKLPEVFNAYLESVGSFADVKGVHPLNEDGTIDFEKDMTVKYGEIDDLQFMEQMDEGDKESWKTLRRHFGNLDNPFTNVGI
jgi:hypothetical protein